MKNKIRFLTEGYADELLLNILEIHPKYIERVGAISKVAKTMKNQLRFYNKTIIAIVDYDKGESLRFFKEFELCSKPDNIILKQKPNSNQYVLFLKPKAIERWILDSSQSVKLKPENYKLSSDLKIFRNQTKSVTASKNKDLIQFIREIKKEKAESFVFLQEILKNLLNNQKYPCKTN